jgi:hypothetical protein
MAAATAAIQDRDNPDVPSLAYTEQARLWAMPRALMGGTAEMRAKARTYLPQETGESDGEYVNRLSRSFLFNAFRRTIGTVTGKVFSKPLVLGKDVPDEIKGYTEDIDLAGRNLDVFAVDLLNDAMQTGLSHILVDMQRKLETFDAFGNPRPPTRQEEAAAGMRPYFVHVKAENLIGWRSETINGVQTLTQIRVRECVPVPDGLFGETTVNQVRVIYRDRFELYRPNVTNGSYEIIQQGPVTFGAIPLATYYTNRTGFMRAEPPLQDMADLNVAHWQSSSDQKNILHFARVPILFRAGFTQKDGGVKEIAATRMFTAENPDAKMEFVEHSGQAIGAGRQDLLDLEDRMRILGLELFTAQPGNVTATGRIIDSEEVNSTVKQLALAEKDCIEQALDFMGRWQGRAKGTSGSVTINTDYGISNRDAQEINSLIEMRKNGEISRETFWSELKRRGTLSDDFDAKQEDLRMAKEDESLQPEEPIDPRTGLPLHTQPPVPPKPPAKVPPRTSVN